MTVSSIYHSPHSSNRPAGRLPPRLPPSDISTLIVGAGVAGLTASLECWRQGHGVRIIERSPARQTSVNRNQGDTFTIGTSAVRALQRWPDMAEENEQISFDPWVSWHKITGEKLAGPAPVQLDPATDGHKDADAGEAPSRTYRHSRPDFHKMLCDQLSRLGIDIEYGRRVVDYFEDSESRQAGVVIEDGETIQADVVIAADGIGSKSSRVTMGEEVRAGSTGFSMYRAAFPVDLAKVDPIVQERFPLLDGFLFPGFADGIRRDGVNAFFGRYHDKITWALTYADRGDSTESWSALVDPAKALQTTAMIAGWPEVADRLIRITPKEYLHDFKLMWREPQPRWVSPEGLIVQIGDAAHTLLPTSGNGATQGIEDAVSLAECLRIAGRDNLHWATRVHNKLRFERVTCLQKLGVINHEARHRSADAKPSQAGLIGLMDSWIWQHDPDRYAADNYEAALAHLVHGTPFHNTNVSPGYVHHPWTINELLKTKENGKDIEVDGHWQ